MSVLPQCPFIYSHVNGLINRFTLFSSVEFYKLQNWGPSPSSLSLCQHRALGVSCVLPEADLQYPSCQAVTTLITSHSTLAYSDELNVIHLLPDTVEVRFVSLYTAEFRGVLH